MRREVLQEIQRQGYLAPDTPSAEAVARSGTSLTAFDPNPKYRAHYNGLLRLRSFHALALHPRLLRILELLFGEPPLVHPRHNLPPGVPRRSAPCLGAPSGLLRRARNHRNLDRLGASGRLHGPRSGAASASFPARTARGLQDADDWTMEVTVPAAARWAWSPMSCGDLLLFHSLTIHQAQRNATDRVRLAVSYRSQPCSHPVAPSSLQPHIAVAAMGGAVLRLGGG